MRRSSERVVLDLLGNSLASIAERNRSFAPWPRPDGPFSLVTIDVHDPRHF